MRSSEEEFNVLQLEIRDKSCAGWVVFTEGCMGGVQGFWLTLKCHFLILLGSKSVQAVGTLCDWDTAAGQNVVCVQMEQLKMGVIFDLELLCTRRQYI